MILLQNYLIFTEWYQSGLYSAFLQLDGGDGVMMDITVTEKRAT